MICYIGLGSNVGERTLQLFRACKIISMNDNITMLQESSIIETKPYGVEDQPDFLNQVIRIHTDLAPEALLSFLLSVESGMGRVREKKWGPRNIDLDILFFGDEVVSMPHLTIPHPGVHEREFVLRSMVELASDYKHPVLQKTMTQLYDELGKEDKHS